jgi:hypothetical protein
MGAPLWTEEERRLLEAAWAAREKSSTLIAEELSRRLARRITRNAVIGRLHRDGLLGRKAGRPKQQKPPPPRPVLWRQERKVEHVSGKLPSFVWRSPLPGEGVPLVELKARSCKWPLAAFAEVATRFCGAQVEAAGGPYCALHARYAFQCDGRRR